MGKRFWLAAIVACAAAFMAASSGTSRAGEKEKTVPPGGVISQVATQPSIFCEPTLYAGTLYYIDARKHWWQRNYLYLFAVDAKTGRDKWRFPIDTLMLSPLGTGGGVVTFVAETKELYALDAASGKEKWRVKADERDWAHLSVGEGAVLCGNERDVRAFDAETGKELWRFETGCPLTCRPAIGGGVAYFGTIESNLYAVDLGTGKEKWRNERFASLAVNALVTVDGDTVYYGNWTVYAVEAATGREKWKIELKAPITGAITVADGVAYLPCAGCIIAVDCRDGAEKWRFTTAAAYEFTQLAASGGVVYVGSKDGFLYAVDAANGKEKWRFKTGGEIHSVPQVVNGVVYFNSWDGQFRGLATGEPAAK